MSDAQDYWDQQYAPATQVWDPSLKTNVNLTGANYTSPTQYIQQNAPSYQGYTGAVGHVANKPIQANAYAPGVTGLKPKVGPTGFNATEYGLAQQRRDINPYDTTNAELANEQLRQFANTVRMLPGTRPDIGVLPGGGFYYLGGQQGGTLGQRIEDDEYAKYGIDPLTQAYGRVAASGPITPTFMEAQQRGLEVSGRGYNYGETSPQDAALEQRFLAGDQRAGQILARSRQARIQVNEPSAMQQFAGKYYAPLVMAAGGLALGGAGAVYGPAFGAGLGATWGAMGAGAMNKWRDPAAIGLGAAGGFAGGYAGSQLGSALGYSPGSFAGGFLQGAGGGLGSSTAQQAYTGDWDPMKIARSTLVSGAAGGVGNYVTGAMTPPGGQPGIGAQAAGRLASAGAGSALGSLWPADNAVADRPRRRNPYA